MNLGNYISVELLVTILLILLFLIFILSIVILAGRRPRKPKEPRQPYRPAQPSRHWTYVPPEKRAGQRGEEQADYIIRRVLREDDILLRNIQIECYEGKTELDKVVINRYGLFIVEVKNWTGKLKGSKDDYEWSKIKDTGANIYVKTVKNPIKQVKRQEFLTHKFLWDNGLDVWVEGYVLLLNQRSPVDSPKILHSYENLDQAIHSSARNHLTPRTIEKIRELLTSGAEETEE